MGSCPRVFFLFLLALSPGFSLVLVLDSSGGLGGKFGSACEEFQDNEDGVLG